MHLKIKLTSFIHFLPNLVDNILCCYIKYLIDKKYHSYWKVLFFIGLFYFIANTIEFIVNIIKDPYNSFLKVIRNGEIKYIILNFFLDSILHDFLRMLVSLIILEYFSLNHVLISHL